MSDELKREIAKEYVDKQLETLKNYNSAPAEMSLEEYNALITEVAELVAA